MIFMEGNKFPELLDQITIQARDLYKLEVNIFLDKDNIVNWIMGLSTGAFVICLTRITKENISILLCPLIISCSIYILLLVSELFQKLYTAGVKRFSGIIDQFFSMSKYWYLNYPDQIQNDLEKCKVFEATSKYVKGEFFKGEMKKDFDSYKDSYEKSHMAAGIAFLFTLFLFILQYLFLVIIIFKSL